MSLQVGDLVQLLGNTAWPGEIGTVISLGYKSGGIAVEFEHYRRSRHTCGGLTKSGYGWYVSQDEVRVIRKATLDVDVEDLI